jgi:hypothetical protein
MQRFKRSQRPKANAYWIEVLLRANWEPGPFDGIELKRGQFVFGRVELAQQLGISEHNVRAITGRFKKLGELTTISTSDGTIGTIVQYDTYAAAAKESNQPTNQRVTSYSPASNHSEETKKQNKPISINQNKLTDRYLKRRSS